jgi:Fibronectin type III domain
MAWSKVQDASTGPSSNTGAATTVAKAYGSNVTSGNLLIAYVTWGDNSTSPSGLSDTRGNTWAYCTNSRTSITESQYSEIWWTISGSSGANTVTATWAANKTYRGLWVIEASGNAASSAFDVAANNSQQNPTTANDNVTSTAATPNQDNSFMVAFTQDIESGAMTANVGTGFTGMTAALDGGGGNAEYYVQTTAASKALTFTATTADLIQITSMAAFKPLSGSPPTAPTIGTVTSITSVGATVNWTDNSSDETGFKVEYSVSPYSSWTAASNSPAAADATSLAVSYLSYNTAYKFRVCATNAFGDSSYSTLADPITTLPAVKVRPQSDITVGPWAKQDAGVTDLYATIDEAVVDDGDYITTISTGTYECKLQNVVDPASSSGHVIWYRLQGPTGTVTVSLVQGTTVIATDTPRTPGAGWTTYSYYLSAGEANSITDYSDLRIRFVVT